MPERKRVSKPTQKAAATPPPDSDFEDADDSGTPPPAKKRKAPAKPKSTEKKKPPVAEKPAEEEKEKEAPKKRKYVPKKGTANHAFLVVLLEAHQGGEETLTKAELMERADKSGLSEKPIFGTEDSKTAAGFPVDGWTNFKTLKKNELVVAEGRPLKIHLTDEGTAAAEELKAEA